MNIKLKLEEAQESLTKARTAIEIHHTSKTCLIELLTAVERLNDAVDMLADSIGVEPSNPDQLVDEPKHNEDKDDGLV